MTRHGELIERLVAQGWSRSVGWKEAIRDKVLAIPFCGTDGLDGLHLSEAFSDAPFQPDAYRLLIEGPEHGWLEPRILVIELVEVVVTSRLTREKLAHYADLWWDCDGSAFVHMRLYVMDEFGNMSCLADVDPDVFEEAAG
jgi:hypothetical protein